MIANMFLIQSLNLMARISKILGKEQEAVDFEREEQAARAEFHDEYITPNGLIASDSQAAYAIAICFGILKPHQQERAADRLVRLVRKNEFKIGTGFAGTPYICEALVLTGHTQIAYSMLLEKECPSWLYPVTMGATTMWERWDSMLPDGSVNPGEMTSFNHYALGAVAKFLYERIAGLQRLEPGWKKIRIAPAMGGEFTSASASHETRYGRVSVTWESAVIKDRTHSFRISVSIPSGVSAEIVLPSSKGVDHDVREVGAGEWTFETRFERDHEWPVLPLPPKS
jgi:alpha-L-rhamnosidase